MLQKYHIMYALLTHLLVIENIIINVLLWKSLFVCLIMLKGILKGLFDEKDLWFECFFQMKINFMLSWKKQYSFFNLKRDFETYITFFIFVTFCDLTMKASSDYWVYQHFTFSGCLELDTMYNNFLKRINLNTWTFKILIQNERLP